MPISKVQVPSLTTPIDIRNGHSANVVYANEQFSAQVNTVNNPYVGLILSLYFPAVLDIESGVKQVSLTFGNSETYTISFLILGYSYEYVVPVLVQIKSIDNGVLTYDILHKGSVPSSSTSIGVKIDEFDDTQLNFDAGSNAQSTIVITYPDEDIEGTLYEVYASSDVPKPTAADEGKTLEVDANGDYVLNSLNIKNGTAGGSLRSINSSAEISGYALGNDAVSFGYGSKASGTSAFAVGANTVASGECSFAGGQYYQTDSTTASGDSSIAFGLIAKATGKASAAFNQYTEASGNSATALGFHTTASGPLSFATGQRTTANGTASVVFGEYNTATHRDQVVLGKYATQDPSTEVNTKIGNYVIIVGNGVFGAPSNALTLDWDGNLVCNNIPAPPSTVGTYSLKCTVDSSGNVTYSWT